MLHVLRTYFLSFSRCNTVDILLALQSRKR